jgi:hypothetical protein
MGESVSMRLGLDYTAEMSKSDIGTLVSDIDSFKVDYSETLDSQFKERFDCHFDLAFWGYTTASFLDEVKASHEQVVHRSPRTDGSIRIVAGCSQCSRASRRQPATDFSVPPASRPAFSPASTIRASWLLRASQG